ncbi:MAG: hypothetical protein WBM72_13480 [Actinomycetota bacterium]
MKRKTLLLLTALPMALLLSSCFVMQGFWINANSIVAGGKATKATFQIHALRGSGDTFYQFFLIGVSDSDDLKAGKATWGTNHVYGGPYPLPSSANLASIIGSDCQSNGFDLASVTGITWRGYTTPTPINDKNKVNKDVMIQVGLKAIASATATEQPVIGVTGAWSDDGNGVPEASDGFICTGVSQVFVNVTT